jgi:hypothetical protein
MNRLISTFFCGFHILAHRSQVCVSKPIPFEDLQDRLSAWLVASCSSCFSDPGHIQNIAGQKSQTVGCQLYTYTVHIPYTPLYVGPGPSLNMFAIALPRRISRFVHGFHHAGIGLDIHHQSLALPVRPLVKYQDGLESKSGSQPQSKQSKQSKSSPRVIQE